ncbi:PH domain-containing protein [Alteromonas sp. ASW11-19]|uniref:PH domain-containing protein n=1 Tax=Alteromonas salexigens TaxID=2982530 RepID=A0ABT2VSP0_9ALTE|nr:PH domain-containing protein [Alteromonas salexigens]MCU7555463.1 PH domain-containing protein [Alteromonas salexigens]
MSTVNTETRPAEGANTSQVDNGDSWRRLSPVSIVYFTTSNLKKLAQFLIYVVPALAVSANVLDLQNSPYTVPVLILVLTGLSLSGVVSYLFYRFRVHDQHVEIRDGVFHRRHVNLPFWRIQNVKIEQPLYYRPMQFALVVLDTAGSAEEEARIVAVPHAYAQQLRKQVLAWHQSPATPAQHETAVTSSTPVSEPGEEVLNRRSIGDLVIHGITNNRVWILLGAAAPFYDTISTRAAEWLGARGLQLGQLAGEQTFAWWQLTLYVISFVTIIMAIIALLSVGGALLTFYDYTLSRHHDRYIRRSGLLNKQEVSMRHSRIQLVRAKQDWLDMLLKRVNLYFEQNTSTAQQHADLMSPNKLLVPSVTVAETRELVEQAMPDSRMYQKEYEGISLRYLMHWLGVWIWPPTILALSALVFLQVWDAAAILLTLSLVISGLLWLRWWRWGVACDKRYMYVRSGRLGVDYQCFELYKAQQVTVVQSVLMARAGVATLKVVLASGQVTVPFLPVTTANRLANILLDSAERSRKSWM